VGRDHLMNFFEILTWTQLGINKKTVYLLNIEGYWDPLIHLIEHMVKQDFADSDLLGKFQVMNSVADLETSLHLLH
jgi:predicted Rossmann-fold nucleotide-binding protein